jgi:bacteriocin-like protein
MDPKKQPEAQNPAVREANELTDDELETVAGGTRKSRSTAERTHEEPLDRITNNFRT